MRDILFDDGRGLYCPAADVHIDPWKPVSRAVVTHAHSDHLTRGCGAYLVSHRSRHVTAARLEDGASVQTLPFGRALNVGGATISLHPASHILGSSQVRVSVGGERWVVTGDFKVARDATTEPFELVPCDTLITESTFALPVYRWEDDAVTSRYMLEWWAHCQHAGRVPVLFAYALGKAQRVLSLLDPPLGPIFVHGAIHRLCAAYAATGVRLPAVQHASLFDKSNPEHRRGIVLGTPGMRTSPWLRRFGPVSTAFASGWMRARGRRRARSLDRGFVLSDHADWDGLTNTIRASGARRVLVTHGYVDVLTRWARERGLDAAPLRAPYAGGDPDGDPDSETDA
ncbi:MAG: ligase-associated DNA damage response exonuclease [Bacteroidota bacterium]